MNFPSFSGYCRALRATLPRDHAGPRRRRSTPLASVERLESRALLSAVHGTIFTDGNANGTRDPGETGTAGITVYLDGDGDHALDADEATAITDADGFYQFLDVTPGEYVVRTVLPAGVRQSTSNLGSFYSIDVTNRRLMKIDDGVVTAIDLLPPPGLSKPALHGLALTNDGELFALEANLFPSDALWKIDPTTGALTRIGATGQNHAWGMSYDPATDTIYGVAFIEGRTRLGTISQQTGTFTAVSTGFGVPSTGGLNALTGVGGLALDTVNRRFIAYDFHDGEIYSFAFDGTAVKLSQTDAGLSGSLAFDGERFVMEHRSSAALLTLDPDAGTWSVLAQTGTLFFEEALEFVPDSRRNYQVTVEDGVTMKVDDLGLVPPPAAILGSLWNDLNGDGVHDVAEPPLAGAAVYIDADNNGQFDAGEATVVTDASGNYAFKGVAAGTYIVRQVLPDGWRQSSPTASGTTSTLIGLTGARDLVVDEGRGLLYVTTDRGVVERIDLATGTKLTGYSVGVNLLGADITPDGRTLYIAEGQLAGSQGVVHKIDLADGRQSSVRYNRTFGESGVYDVAIGANGKGLVTTQYAGSGWTPLRILDTATDTFLYATGEHSQVRQNTQIHRGDDRSLFFLMEANISSGPIFTYDVATNSFPQSFETSEFLGSRRAAVNRDGSLIALEIGRVSIMDRDFQAVENLSGITGGFAFDPTKDVFYGIDASSASNDWVVAFDTKTWSELYRFRIGENMTSGGAFGSGTMRVTADGRWLALVTPAGVRIFDLVAASGGRTATVTPTSGALGVTFSRFDATPAEVRISDATVVEGTTGETRAELTVTLSKPMHQTARVTYQTVDGSATVADGDYTTASGTLEFAPGETSKTVTVLVRGDSRDELDERFIVTLLGGPGIADGQGVVTIENDDVGARGSIGGTLWEDIDGDGVHDAGETPLAGWTTYLDANNNGRLDSGERTVVTGSDGRYTFTDLPAGEYTVAQILPGGWVQTSNRGPSAVAEQRYYFPTGARDVVHDALRNHLLITTDRGTVERFDLHEMRLLNALPVGDALLGADITADGTRLYVAEAVRNVTQGIIREVSLTDGSVTNWNYDLASGEGGAFDVAITSNGRALVTTQFEGSGWTPLRTLDLATGEFAIRPGLGSGVRQNTALHRGADGTGALLLEGNSSAGPIRTYDAVEDVLPGYFRAGWYLTSVPGAVNRDGTLYAVGFNGLALFDRNLQPLPAPVMSGSTTGLAFDPTRDVLYRAGTTEIIAYETDGFTELFRFPIGGTLPSGKNPMVVSADGRQLFFGTGSGGRIYQLIVDARRITLAAGQSVTDVDFLSQQNQDPTATDDSFSTTEEVGVTGNLLANDSDSDGTFLAIDAVNDVSTAVGRTISLASGATLTVQRDGVFSYDPNGAFDWLLPGETATDSFTYTIRDAWGGTATAQVTLTIAGDNPPPVAVADTGFAGPHGIAAGNVLANDSDGDGDTFAVSAVNGDATAVGRMVTLASGATLVLNADGAFVYDPNGVFDALGPNQTATDSFTYTVRDSEGGTATAAVTITIQGSARYFSVADAQVVEGAPGVTRIEVRLNEPLAAGTSATVNYTLKDGTATAGGDYVFQTGTLVFSGSTTIQTIDIETTADGQQEGDEVFFVTLSGATNAGIAKPDGRITIVDPWQAESPAFGHLIGRADGDGWSANTKLDDPGFLLFGPYTTAIPTGVQIATFRMLVDNTTADNAKVARIEVFNAATGTILAQRVLQRGEFTTPFQHQDFGLAFENPAGSRLEFRLWWHDTSYVRVDRIQVTTDPPPPLVLDANTQFHHQLGRVTAEGWTANTALDNAGYLAFGPYTTAVPAGHQSAAFRLRVDNNSANNAPVVTLDVHDAATGRLLAQRVVRRTDFVAANVFQEFTLDFENPFGSRLEFRTYWHDTALVTLDRVIVTRTPTPPPLRFEAEATGVFGHQVGRAVADGWSANTIDDNPGYLAYGPYTTAVAAGAHVALFRLLVDNHTANNAPIVTLDVVDADRGQRLAARTLTRQEFSAAYTYQFFALPFTNSNGAQLEFRTYWHDTSFVQLDEVAVLDAPVPQRLIETEGPLVGHTTGRATAGGWSANVAEDAAGWLAVGPYDQGVLPSGTYTASFRLLVTETTLNSYPLVTLDVFDRTSGQVLARRTLTRFEFRAANTFQEFGLTFTSAPDARLEYRTFWHDRAYVEQDSVSVRPATWTADELEPVFDEIEELLLTA